MLSLRNHRFNSKNCLSFTKDVCFVLNYSIRYLLCKSRKSLSAWGKWMGHKTTKLRAIASKFVTASKFKAVANKFVIITDWKKNNWKRKGLMSLSLGVDLNLVLQWTSNPLGIFPTALPLCFLEWFEEIAAGWYWLPYPSLSTLQHWRFHC